MTSPLDNLSIGERAITESDARRVDGLARVDRFDQMSLGTSGCD